MASWGERRGHAGNLAANESGQQTWQPQGSFNPAHQIGAVTGLSIQVGLDT